MVGLVALIASVAALDSINPSTVGPALLFALGREPRREVAAFTAGVFGVSTLGGLALLFGPGRALLAHVARPSAHTQHLIEALTGVALLVAALLLWILRGRIGRRLRSARRRNGRSALALGAGIMAVELPTAFPYFAGLIATVEGGQSALTDAALVLLYNVVFVAPLLTLLVLVTRGGALADRVARAARRALEAHAPVLAPVTLGSIGVVLLLIGGSRL